MPSKNDLSAFKKPEKKAILPSKAASNDGAPVKTKGKKPLTGQMGRPTKPDAEKHDYKIQLSLTKGQGAKLKEKAGLASEAVVIREHLKSTGFFD